MNSQTLKCIAMGLKHHIPSQGLSQMLTPRKAILDEYDRAREQARLHEVETFHGLVAEASVRKWLAEFLPGRYGVSSGYVITYGLPPDAKAPHYDVIIYDKLESPVLWIEGSADTSNAGRSLAIPVEHVFAVLEIKSRFNAQNVRDSIEHLGDLKILLGEKNDIRVPESMYLPQKFVCASVFIDDSLGVSMKQSSLEAFVPGLDIRGYIGGIILRGAWKNLALTGRVNVNVTPYPVSGHVPILDTPSPDRSTVTDSVEIADSEHATVFLYWLQSAFVEFAFELLSHMRGRNGMWSGSYGRGHE